MTERKFDKTLKDLWEDAGGKPPVIVEHAKNGRMRIIGIRHNGAFAVERVKEDQLLSLAGNVRYYRLFQEPIESFEVPHWPALVRGNDGSYCLTDKLYSTVEQFQLLYPTARLATELTPIMLPPLED